MGTKQIIPKHIAIIMDGNRRWARAQGLPVLSGHAKVADDILEPLVEYAADKGVEYITFWAFSTENWAREAKEVSGIMQIFRHMINKRWARLHEKGVRIKVIGDISRFAPDIVDSLTRVIEQTKDNKRITAVFALNYGGRDEMLRAIKKVGDPQTVTDASFSSLLDTKDIPDPEFIVRTGGEQRLSGFLLWQCQYSELYFPSWFMPEFTREKLDEVLEEYATRHRRFGK
jgi:undecaprenyl diphosphate synthase